MLYESPMSPRTGPAIPHAGPFDRTLSEERARNTRRINTFRFQALTAFLALLLLLRLSIRGYISAVPHALRPVLGRSGCGPVGDPALGPGLGGHLKTGQLSTGQNRP